MRVKRIIKIFGICEAFSRKMMKGLTSDALILYNENKKVKEELKRLNQEIINH